ncbi:unnamed protein product [Phytophthora lilii]|uniref:Unnamed protein product n=1 Tax=Phytophthora lilii TaxID=2077276 RepID=A0A9W6UD01_9STRA|nr:unnamed protein product [Phytophthora lilii]
MKSNIAGGPSIIFNRYAKRNETTIRGGKICKKIIGYARREGDADKSKAMIAEMIKLVGNIAFGRSGMDMSKHKEIKYESSDKAIKNKIKHFSFNGLRS